MHLHPGLGTRGLIPVLKTWRLVLGAVGNGLWSSSWQVMAQHLCSCSTLSHILDFGTSVGEDGTGRSFKKLSCRQMGDEWEQRRRSQYLAGPHSFVQMRGRGESSRQGQWELEGPPENSVCTSHFIGEETDWERREWRNASTLCIFTWKSSPSTQGQTILSVSLFSA